MAKAPASEQLRLLDLQALDSKVTQLDRRSATVAKNADIDALLEKLATADSELVTINTEVGDTQRELQRAETDVEMVQTRIDRDPSFKGDRILVMKFPYDLAFLPGASPGAFHRPLRPT